MFMDFYFRRSGLKMKRERKKCSFLKLSHKVLMNYVEIMKVEENL